MMSVMVCDENDGDCGVRVCVNVCVSVCVVCVYTWISSLFQEHLNLCVCV